MCSIVDFREGSLIVSGTPGVGKTTVARRLAGRHGRAAHISGDDVTRMIVSGHVGPVNEPKEETDRQLILRAHNICSLANNFARFGFYPILDHVLPNRSILDLMIRLLRPRPVLLATLAPSLDVAVRRTIGRPQAEQVDYSFDQLSVEMGERLRSLGGGSTPPI